jgi:hypothetical protein
MFSVPRSLQWQGDISGLVLPGIADAFQYAVGALATQPSSATDSVSCTTHGGAAFVTQDIDSSAGVMQNVVHHSLLYTFGKMCDVVVPSAFSKHLQNTWSVIISTTAPGSEPPETQLAIQLHAPAFAALARCAHRTFCAIAVSCANSFISVSSIATAQLCADASK